MSRIPQIADAEASPSVRDLFGAIRSQIGMVPNLYRVAANEPAVLKSMLAVNEALASGRFDNRTREAIALAVAGANECDYCASAHAAISAGLKVDEATIQGHLAGRSADARLQAILDLALAISAEKGRVDDMALAAARAAGLTDADIVEIAGHVVANIFTNYLNHVAETEIDFPVRAAAAA